MRLTLKQDNLAIVDDVLEKDQFEQFWYYFNTIDYAYRSMSGWQKVWRISDNQILASAPYYHAEAPFNNPMDWLHQIILSLTSQHFEDIVGKQGKDWQEFFLTPYIYPQGTKISWHDDYGYVGACIFYPHKEWNPNWGGELMVANVPQVDNPPTVHDNMTRDYINPQLNHYGMGLYTAPSPNRLVFLKGGSWHQINRVDQNAGDHMRCSVVGFFTKEKVEL
jgi:hypothetical protein